MSTPRTTFTTWPCPTDREIPASQKQSPLVTTDSHSPSRPICLPFYAGSSQCLIWCVKPFLTTPSLNCPCCRSSFDSFYKACANSLSYAETRSSARFVRLFPATRPRSLGDLKTYTATSAAFLTCRSILFVLIKTILPRRPDGSP